MSRLLRKNNGFSLLGSGIVNVLTKISLTGPSDQGQSEADDKSPASSISGKDLLIRGRKKGLRAVLKTLQDLLHGQAGSSFSSASSQDLPTILGAHAFAKSVLALFLQVRRLLKRE